MKIARIAGAVVAAVIVLVAIVLTVGLPSNLLTSAIRDRLARDTGFRIEIDGATRVALWPAFHLTLNDVSLDRRAGADDAERIEIASARIEMPLASLLAGKPAVTALTLDRPVAYLPLLRERRPASPSPATGSAGDAPEITIDRVTVRDGAVVFANPRDKVEDRIEGIDATATIDAGRAVAMTATGRSGAHTLTLDLRATLPEDGATRRPFPVELTFEAPGLLADTLTAKADVRLAGATLRINGVSGALGGKPFTGWASVDLAGKPLVKIDLDIRDLAIGKTAPDTAPAPAAWSDVPFDLRGLNYVDADVRVSAARLSIGDVRIAPLALGATLKRGTLAVRVDNLGLYDGLASGGVSVDASGPTPRYTMQGDLAGVSALPALTGLAGFDRLEGKLQAKFAVQSTGNSPRAIVAALDGTAFLDFRDGKIRGINVAQMIRTLTASTLNGWQADEVQATDMSQLSASFRISQGKAETADLALAGPLVRMRGGGTVDLACKALALRVEPKLVMSLEGQGGEAEPVGLGIPVAIRGPWAAPHIYPDMAGILDNPEAAYARLRELGQGLFGAGSGDAGNSPGEKTPGEKTLGETLGGLIRQGLGGQQPGAQDPAGDPAREPATGGGGASAIDGILKQLFGR